MRRAVATVTIAVLLATCAGCEARVYGNPGHQPEGPGLTAVPAAPTDATPLAPPAAAAASLADLALRAEQAVAEAAERGADISFRMLDRQTGRQVAAGAPGLATASVVKLFIADDLLMREPDLSAADRESLDVMLRSSDDNAAEEFWNRGGGEEIIGRVAARYGLAATAPPSNGRWWNTVSTTEDLVRFYDKLLDGSGGLPPERANIILNDLAQSTPEGIDGYPQRFGIPDGLPGEPVAVKQGWMCCIGPDWMHLSSGIVGADRRYVMVVYALQPTDDATARNTITDAIRTIFPTGRI
ncbi:LppW family protein [Mycolicibacterium chitae]|uniref:Alanine rich lipoprotein lppW n=2 Tax=Mycobacteriaceae TaxID=1762 RepID=A0A448I8I6_MYCCI|nr:hypothetical protein [Mycolicibacterium chitae]MCV7105905.1 hypothetical protein [Mycolicibacterium chitae]BBZ05100.1 LppW family protein [Mycolicibacterium chitae]VEG48721.1 alanine rich lipoprotein lppW [Mycolicibacterium chitae]